MWRCVLHGRVSSFFRPSESGVREFFGAAVLAGLGSFLGGVWLFRICCGFFRPSESGVREFFGAAVLAGLGSFLGGVWLFRICCGEVGFWCGGAFCTVEFHLSLGHQKVALESFLAPLRPAPGCQASAFKSGSAVLRRRPSHLWL